LQVLNIFCKNKTDRKEQGTNWGVQHALSGPDLGLHRRREATEHAEQRAAGRIKAKAHQAPDLRKTRERKGLRKTLPPMTFEPETPYLKQRNEQAELLLVCDSMQMRCILRYVLAEIWTRTFMAGKHHLDSQSRDSGRTRMG
jgi:hypothetical protein